MTPAAQRILPGALASGASPATRNPKATRKQPESMKTITIIAALFAAVTLPAAAASTDDKPRVFAPITVEPACVPGECSGK